MKMDKATKVSIIVASVITAVGSALMATGLLNMAQYVWIFFCGFTITTGALHGIKNLPNLVCSHAAGWLWAMVMYYICLFIMGITGILALGFLVCIFVGSVLMLAFHLGLTMKTWFNCIPVMYATIFCWFSIQDFSQIVFIVFAFLFGGICSLLSDEIQGKMLG